jgi:hypothetical protein
MTLKLRRIIRLLSLLLALGVTGGCSQDPSIGCFYVEIAPAKFVPVRFNEKHGSDMFIRYENQTVVFKLPRGLNSPRTLMEHEGRLYVMALDASGPGVDVWRYRFWRQKGQGFGEIEAKDFPRSIAIFNIWRPGDRNRYATGMTQADKLDFVILGRELDPENGYFVNSYQARLWWMLENQNSLGLAERTFGGEEGRKFLREYIAKYQPVKLTSMEPTPVPKGECDF